MAAYFPAAMSLLMLMLAYPGISQLTTISLSAISMINESPNQDQAPSILAMDISTALSDTIATSCYFQRPVQPESYFELWPMVYWIDLVNLKTHKREQLETYISKNILLSDCFKNPYLLVYKTRRVIPR